MHRTTFHGREAVQMETERVRVTILEEGGHIAELLNKRTGVNPLWIPPWTSIDPSSWPAQGSPAYGNDSNAQVYASILGHSLCLDLFGVPSVDEARSGIRIHGEAGLVPWEFNACPGGAVGRCLLPSSRLACERTLTLHENRMAIQESVENLDAWDRPIAWTQHVTLGPPFLERGKTLFRASTAMGCHYIGYGDKKMGESWHETPGGFSEELSAEASSGGFRSYFLDPAQPDAYFVAWSPACETAIAYAWKQSDFPWIGVWDENSMRTEKPWSGRTLARGMEFAATPFPGPRREMLARGPLFDTPAYRWVPAKGKVTVTYEAVITEALRMPASFAECAASSHQAV